MYIMHIMTKLQEATSIDKAMWGEYRYCGITICYNVFSNKTQCCINLMCIFHFFPICIHIEFV